MPFTPSHAVVALPFVPTRLVPAAIAIGAMTPDLPLFLRGIGLDYGRMHDLAWIPFTVVIALVLLLAWRCALRPAVRELAPRALAVRLPAAWDAGAASALRETFAVSGAGPRASWRGTLLLLISLALGVASHIVWDLFTHEGRWGSQVIPALEDKWGPLAGYTWLQHGSSAVGLVILAVWATIWVIRRDAAGTLIRVLPVGVRVAWWLSLPGILAVAWVGGLLAYGPLTAEWTIAHLAYRVLPPACAIWAVLTLALCLVVAARRRLVKGR